MFSAQLISLLGTGMSTIALGLLAARLAGESAGQVLGTALAIKMVVYVFLAPFFSVLFAGFNRRSLLILLDLVRAGLILVLLLVDSVWQIYLLIFLINCMAAAFTPVFQASIADLLPVDDDYNRAISLSRLAYDLENLASPLICGLILGISSFQTLFWVDALTFLASALFLAYVSLPVININRRKQTPVAIVEATMFGMGAYLRTTRLKYSMILGWLSSLAGAMVIVNTVVIVQEKWHLQAPLVAYAFAFFGTGSIVAALSIPGLLRKISVRLVMLMGASVLLIGFLLGIRVESYAGLSAIWVLLGLGSSMLQTPAGQLVRHSSSQETRQDYYAAQFAFSHLGWLLAYPLAGYALTYLGMAGLFLLLACSTGFVLLLIFLLWKPGYDAFILEHRHESREIAGSHGNPALVHSHHFVIDRQHPRWPNNS